MNIINRLQMIKEVIETPEAARRISQAAAFRVIAEYKTRIFNKGLDSSGNEIGVYSENPFYINPLSLVGVKASGVKPEGKTGQKVFKNGNKHKTKYLTNGYKELRDLTGRQSSKVDLNFSGSMAFSVKVQQVGDDSVIMFTDDKSASIMEGQEVRFGTIISEPTQEERESGTEAARLELRAILDEITS